MTSIPSDDGATRADQADTTTTSPSPAASDAGVKGKAQQAAGEAGNQAQHVGGVAKDQASQVADETKQHAKGLLDEATSQVDDQARTQLGRLSETLRSVGGDLDDMAAGSDRDGVARTLAQEVATRARTLGEHLDGREPRDLLDDVRAYARRRPGTFLLGALAAGVVAGRLARGAQSANSDSTSSSTAPEALTSTGRDQHPDTTAGALPSGDDGIFDDQGAGDRGPYGDASTGLRSPDLGGTGSPAGTTPDLGGPR